GRRDHRSSWLLRLSELHDSNTGVRTPVELASGGEEGRVRLPARINPHQGLHLAPRRVIEPHPYQSLHQPPSCAHVARVQEPGDLPFEQSVLELPVFEQLTERGVRIRMPDAALDRIEERAPRRRRVAGE